MKALTTEQSQLLSRLVDVTWEADNTSNSPAERDEYRNEMYDLRLKLHNSMGADAYYEMMRMGREMFAPAKS